MRTRSPRLAVDLARLLNGEAVEERRVDQPSMISTYSVVRAGRKPELFLVVALEPTRSNPGRFGGGVLAMTSDEVLAAEVVGTLNRIDPRARPRTTRGMGWF